MTFNGMPSSENRPPTAATNPNLNRSAIPITGLLKISGSAEREDKMPIHTSIGIQGSVGKGGQNLTTDVWVVQERLNDLMGPSRVELEVDGKSGPLTRGKIYDFQKNVLGMLRPDSRVDAIGKTIAALNDPASEMKWRRMSVARPAGERGDPGTVPYLADMEQAFEKAGMPEEFKSFRRMIIDDKIPKIKIFLGTIGRAEDARWGLTASEASIVFRAAIGFRNQRAALKLMAEMGDPASKLGKVIGQFGKGIGLVGQLVTLIEVADKFEQGDYLFGLTELYKYAMGKAIPWAGMIDGLQSLVESVLPKSAKNSMVFKLVRACDPIGLGATAVDAMSTMVIGAVELIMSGKMDNARLNRLVERMKQGPTTLFAEMGENLGDALFELSH